MTPREMFKSGLSVFDLNRSNNDGQASTISTSGQVIAG